MKEKLIYVIGIDLDDTLFHEQEAALQGFNSVARLISNRTNYNFETIEDYLSQKFYQVGRNRLLEELISFFNISDVTLAEMIHSYRTTSLKINLYPDVANLFQYVYKLGYPMVLITDGVAIVQREKIASLNISNHFDRIFITSEIGTDYTKPSRKVFDKVISDYRILPEKFVYIGDNPYKDVSGVRAVGSRTIRVLKGPFSQLHVRSGLEADLTIHSFIQLEGKGLDEHFRN